MMKFFAALVAATVALSLPTLGFAFCGFYVAGGGESLVSDATQVVMMRYGTTTIQSMQNNYKGPPEDFAMVVPVPQVLREENVKTLPHEAFAKIDLLTSPRLVEYWEQDPCQPRYDDYLEMSQAMPTSEVAMNESVGGGPEPKVKIEAQFEVGEYDIVILSATESTALDTWLRQNGYKIPEGAAPYLAPYVEGGMYFFVAKVDVDKVEKSAGGLAVLSPIRFHYENDAFFLPVRLGMINSAGQQDLVVYVLGESFRFEVANRPNVFIPTNLEVKDEVRSNFPQFYESLFAGTIKDTPGAIVTEYSWGAAACDPCPGPTLAAEDILTFGADVISSEVRQPWAWVVTRLHARYGVDDIGEDLVFEKAAPIVGGREVRGADGALERGAQPIQGQSNFQGRYIIRHEWSGAADCENPQFGVWGGPPSGGTGVVGAPSANTRGEAPPKEIPVDYTSFLVSDAPAVAVTPPREVRPPGPSKQPRGMCAGCSTQDVAGNGAWLALLGGVGLLSRRRRRSAR